MSQKAKDYLKEIWADKYNFPSYAAVIIMFVLMIIRIVAAFTVFSEDPAWYAVVDVAGNAIFVVGMLLNLHFSRRNKAHQPWFILLTAFGVWLGSIPTMIDSSKGMVTVVVIDILILILVVASFFIGYAEKKRASKQRLKEKLNGLKE